MRTRIGSIGVFALAAAMVACGDDKGASSTTSTTATVTTVQVGLLAAADVGSVWKLSNAVNEADFTDSMQMPCADSAINPTIVERLTPTSGVQFEPVDHGYQHLIEMVVTGEPSRLGTDAGILIEALRACVANPTADILGYTEMTIPAIGDRSAAFQYKGYQSGDSGPVWFTRSAILEVSGVLVTIGLTEILDTTDMPPRFDDAEFVRILEAAVALLGS